LGLRGQRRGGLPAALTELSQPAHPAACSRPATRDSSPPPGTVTLPPGLSSDPRSCAPAVDSVASPRRQAARRVAVPLEVADHGDGGAEEDQRGSDDGRAPWGTRERRQQLHDRQPGRHQGKSGTAPGEEGSLVGLGKAGIRLGAFRGFRGTLPGSRDALCPSSRSPSRPPVSRILRCLAWSPARPGAG
jgi:hypothetical protein